MFRNQIEPSLRSSNDLNKQVKNLSFRKRLSEKFVVPKSAYNEDLSRTKTLTEFRRLSLYDCIDDAGHRSGQIIKRLSLCDKDYKRSLTGSFENGAKLDGSTDKIKSTCSPLASETNLSIKNIQTQSRKRARSLNHSPKSHQTDMFLQNEKFRKIFPKACRQMEDNLTKFIETNRITTTTSITCDSKSSSQNGSFSSAESKSVPKLMRHPSMSNSTHILDPAARFIQNQVIEIAKLCLEKSKSNQLTCLYFDDMAKSLEKLLEEARDKCSQIHVTYEYLFKLIKRFLLIASRVARLLECIEFDAYDAYFLINSTEQQAKQQSINTDLPKYIFSVLGIGKEPFENFNNGCELLFPPPPTVPPTLFGLGVSEASVDSEQLLGLTSYSDQNDKFGLNRMSSRCGSGGDFNDETSDYFTSSDLSLAVNLGPSAPTPTILPPCEDDFEKIKLISNGAYGAVYLVRHRNLGQRFAMKKIKKHNIILRNQVQQVFTERDIMTFTDNPFVVALVCTFETRKYLCMVMEYVEGGDVATLIKNMGPLPLDMARSYFAETSLAVEYLHNYGIIHRDLKPDNLLITSLGHIKLTDFGLSKIGLMNLTTNFYEGGDDVLGTSYSDSFVRDRNCKEFDDKQICGTPQYLAPEVILRECYGKTVDWWSMGIILYEFLTSFPPFHGNTPEDLFSNVINGEVDWPDENDQVLKIPSEARDLITHLLTHDAVHRLGANGANEIKQHPFFDNFDWNNLLRTKSEFIPQLDGPDDTSYFDTRSERYNHDDSEESSSSSCSSSSSSSTSNSTSGEDFVSKIRDKTTRQRRSPLSEKKKTDNCAVTTAMNVSASRTATNSKRHRRRRAPKPTSIDHDGGADSNIIDGLGDCENETDNELFASFSSYSSKFKLSSLSASNSPILFVNDCASSTNCASLATSASGSNHNCCKKLSNEFNMSINNHSGAFDELNNSNNHLKTALNITSNHLKRPRFRKHSSSISPLLLGSNSEYKPNSITEKTTPLTTSHTPLQFSLSPASSVHNNSQINLDDTASRIMMLLNRSSRTNSSMSSSNSPTLFANANKKPNNNVTPNDLKPKSSPDMANDNSSSLNSSEYSFSKSSSIHGNNESPGLYALNQPRC